MFSLAPYNHYHYLYFCFRASLQKLTKHDVIGFSNNSILNSMERFIQTVCEMENTILIPSRLLDLTVGDSQDRLQLGDKRSSIINATLANTNLYHLYNVISQMKIEILWSQNCTDNFQETENDFVVSAEKLKRSRSSSSTSMYSMQSIYTSSNSESDTFIENNFGAENENDVSATAQSFKKHLHGLHRNIQKMTLAAEYLILRYQNVIDHRT